MLVLVAAAALVVGCGSDDSKSPGTTAAGTTAESGGAAGKKLRIIHVGAAPKSEAFTSVAANGLEQAGRDFNLETIWRGPQQPNPSDPTEVVRLLENAIASKPDGLVVTDIFPKQYNPVIKAAVAKGIPVILSAAGDTEVDNVGALTYVGNDERASGRLAGQEMARIGGTHALVIALPRGIPAFDARVDGFKEGFNRKVTVLEVPLNDVNDTTKVRNLIEIELQKDSSIDSVWPIGTGIGAPVLAALDRLGEKAKKMFWGQLGIDGPTIDALKAKKYNFSTDQQQYLQGYLPAMWLSFYIRYGMKPVDKFIRTGPTLVTPEDAQKVSELSAQKIR